MAGFVVMATTIYILRKNLILQWYQWCEKFPSPRELILYLPLRDGPGITTLPGVKVMQSSLMTGSPSLMVPRCPNTGQDIPGGLARQVPLITSAIQWIPRTKTSITSQNKARHGILSA